MKRIAIQVVVVTIVVVATLSLIATATVRTNCGGNTAALFVCGEFAGMARMNSEGTFDFSKLRDDERKHLASLVHYHWLSGASLWVRRGGFKADNDQRQIIAVLDKAYGNVPQPTLWNGYKRTPAHAVAYSDGSPGLISPAQFQSLDLSDFVDANELILTNRVAIPTTIKN